MIRNAADSMPQGGALGLKTSREGDMISLQISDSGSGIPPHIMDRLFDPFFTTKPDGTGLGLAVSKKIVDDHGGRVEVQSTIGKGTTFRILLPLHPTPALQTPPASASGSLPWIKATPAPESKPA